MCGSAASRVGSFTAMPGEFFFMALGGLGVSLAGFVGIITALDRSEDARSVISMWRVRNIVWAGITLTIIGFGIVAIHTATGDNVGLTIRITSLFVIVINGVRLLTEFRPGLAWPDRNSLRMAVLLESVGIVGFGVAAITAHVGLFQLLLVYQLGFPLSIFFFTIRDTAGGGPKPDRSTTSET